MGLSDREAEKRAETWVKLAGPSAFKEPLDPGVWLACKEMTLEQFAKYKAISQDQDHPWVQEYYARVENAFGGSSQDAKAKAGNTRQSYKEKMVILAVQTLYACIMIVSMVSFLIWLL